MARCRYFWQWWFKRCSWTTNETFQMRASLNYLDILSISICNRKFSRTRPALLTHLWCAQLPISHVSSPFHQRTPSRRKSANLISCYGFSSLMAHSFDFTRNYTSCWASSLPSCIVRAVCWVTMWSNCPSPPFPLFLAGCVASGVFGICWSSRIG